MLIPSVEKTVNKWILSLLVAVYIAITLLESNLTLCIVGHRIVHLPRSLSGNLS